MQVIIVCYSRFLKILSLQAQTLLKFLDYGLVRFCAPQYLAAGRCHGMSDVEDNWLCVASLKYCCLRLHLCCAEVYSFFQS